jgi:hypothetical protein
MMIIYTKKKKNLKYQIISEFYMICIKFKIKNVAFHFTRIKSLMQNVVQAHEKKVKNQRSKVHCYRRLIEHKNANKRQNNHIKIIRYIHIQCDANIRSRWKVGNICGFSHEMSLQLEKYLHRIQNLQHMSINKSEEKENIQSYVA